MPSLTSLLRRMALVVVLALAVAGLDACTNGTEEPAPSSAPKSAATTEPEPELTVVTRVTRLAGDLPEKRREELVGRTRQLVRAYVQRALLEPDPGAGYVGFTRGAEKLARHDEAVLSARGLGDDAQVEPRRVAAYLSVLAAHRRVVGATVRLDVALRVTEDGVTRPMRLAGRLLLTPSPQKLRVFGYDLRRGGV